MPGSHFLDDMSLYADPMQLATGDSEAIVSLIDPVPSPSIQLDLLAPGIAPNKCIYPPLPRIPGANISEEEAAHIDQLSQDAVRRCIEQHHLEQQILLSDVSRNAWPQNLPIRQVDCKSTVSRPVPFTLVHGTNFLLDQAHNEVHHQPSPPSNAEIDYSLTGPATVAWDFQNGEAAPSLPSTDLTGPPFPAASAPFDVTSSSFGGFDMANPAIDFSDFDFSSALFGGPVDFPDFDPSSFALGGPAMTAPVLDLPPFDPSSFALGGPATTAWAPAPPQHHALPLPYPGPAMTLSALPQPTFLPPSAPLDAPITTTTTPKTLPPRPKKQRRSRMPAPRPSGNIFQVDTPDTLREGRFAGDSSRNYAFQAGPGWSRDRFRTGPKEQAAADAAAAAGRSPGISRVKKGKAQGRQG